MPTTKPKLDPGAKLMAKLRRGRQWHDEQARKPGIFLPIECKSEANRRDKWAGIKRAKDQRAYARARLNGYRPVLPCVVVLTRYGPRFLDSFDNLPRSLKAVADGVCDAFGVDDKPGTGLRFRAEQEQAPFYGVRILVQSAEVSP